MRLLAYFTIIAIFCAQGIFLNAKELNSKEAAQQAVQENLKMPKPDPDGRISTLNKMGAMSPDLDAVSKLFVAASKVLDAKVLEIGAGYGLACQESLKAGCTNYTAVDLDDRHLKLLAKNVKDVDASYLNSVKLISGSFPTETDIPSNHYDAILMARVLHFMTPQEISASLAKAYDALKPGASVYVVLLTPYVKGYASFIPEFQRRIDEGVEFPGFVENKKDYADKKIIPPSVYSNLGGHFYFFDVKTAQTFFEKAGFIVEKSEYAPLPYKSDIWQLDGRENVLLVAKKPVGL